MPWNALPCWLSHRSSCTWLASLCSPHLQACMFLEVMEMHFLKMLDNSALS